MAVLFDMSSQPAVVVNETPPPKGITLYQLNLQISQLIASHFSQPVWVQAEISRLEIKSNGHCYIELIEKDANATKAQTKAVIWAREVATLRASFEKETGQPLAANIKVLVLAKVEFHAQYGYSLHILNIDPTFTVGDMMRRRLEILQRLTKEGIIDINRQLPLPKLMQRIAVISSETAAGYEDFVNTLISNQHGLAFCYELFQAKMQGAETETSVIAALELIRSRATEFDAVVIIRGGGAVSDLAAFDSYPLARAVALCPLPVITGIGHERDDTVTDRVSHTKAKTPTAVAEYIIAHQCKQLEFLNNCSVWLSDRAKQILSLQSNALLQMGNALTRRIPQILIESNTALTQLQHTITGKTELIIQQQRSKLDLIEQQVRMSDPRNILKRGYAIIRKHGKPVASVNALPPNEQIEICLADGTTQATIN